MKVGIMELLMRIVTLLERLVLILTLLLHAAPSSSSPTSSLPTTSSWEAEYGLPQGVSSLEKWGSTVLKIGKYSGTRYDALPSSYVLWIMNATKPDCCYELRDLKAYVNACTYYYTKHKTPMIPGISFVPRSFCTEQ